MNEETTYQESKIEKYLSNALEKYGLKLEGWDEDYFEAAVEGYLTREIEHPSLSYMRFFDEAKSDCILEPKDFSSDFRKYSEKDHKLIKDFINEMDESCAIGYGVGSIFFDEKGNYSWRQYEGTQENDEVIDFLLKSKDYKEIIDVICKVTFENESEKNE